MSKGFGGARTLLRFSSGTEACLWLDGVPYAGLDPYHDTAPIFPREWGSRSRARGTESIDLWVEAACNLPLGATTFWWDQPEQRARWKESMPGRLECAELVAIDEEVWQFCARFDWLRRMLSCGNAEDARTNDIARGLASIIRAIPAGTASRRSVIAQRGALDRLLRGHSGSQNGVQCVAIGHAHIDTAWLWRIDETRRKCVRSFATALRNIERFPHFRFLCSQAQQYQFVKEESPALFAEIAKAVRARRWEPAGAMWVEPDCTAPSGESFIRQIVHGTSWWRREFGERGRQRILFLPDTFGFPACLPQIMAKAGLDTFITNKIIWSDTNRFPHVTFQWRGLDGTQVLAHLTPGHNYNSDFVPEDLALARANIERQDRGRTRVYLQPYGWGDGGGGPDPAQIERTMSAAQCEGVPRTTHTTVADFCTLLHTEARTAESQGDAIPVWDGELYLEAHRGTYTTQRWIKQANRTAEQLLRQVEVLAVIAPVARRAHRALLKELDSIWKVVLLHQFHDILPGSSIGAVYRDAREALGGAIRALTSLRDDGIARAARTLRGHRGTVAFNPASTPQAGLPECSVGVVATRSRRDAQAEAAEASARTLTLSNALMRVKLDRLGRVASLETADGRALPRPGRAFNELVLYEDRPCRWEAWETDKEYLEKPTAVKSKCSFTSRVTGGVATITVERVLGQSSAIRQTYELGPWSDTLVVRTRLDWREERTLLRALFPTRIRARTARFGTQCGHIDRDAHRNTSWQEAQFEVPGHDWMCISDTRVSFAIIDDGIFGRSAHDGTLGLSLVKSPNFPDPEADRGVHEFAYGLRYGSAASMPWGAADRLNNSVVRGRTSVSAQPAPHTTTECAFVRLHTDADEAGIEISALKPASDGSRDVILRLVDRTGAAQRCVLAWSRPVLRVSECDLFEDPIGRGKIALADGKSLVNLKPFEILSLRVRVP